MRNMTIKTGLLALAVTLSMQGNIAFAAYEAETRNACPQRWELVLKDGIPKRKVDDEKFGAALPIDKIWSTSNIWSIKNYFSGGKAVSVTLPFQVSAQVFSTSAPSDFNGYPVPLTNLHLIKLANEDRVVRRGLFLTTVEQTKWSTALADRATDMQAVKNHLQRAQASKTIDPAELDDLVFDELTVASECIRYRNMMTDTAGYVAPASNPNYSYGWLPAVL